MKKNRKTHGRLAVILIFMVCLLGFLGYELYISKYHLTTSYYKITSPKLTEGFRITQLTDLHNSTFGDNNDKLITEVKKTEPDLILITGDLVNDKQGTDTSIATTLIKKLSDIAPIYFSYGNQEISLKENYKTDINSLYEEAGAIVLDDDFIDIEVNGQPIRLGGIYGYCQPVAYAIETHRENETEYLMDFQDTKKDKNQEIDQIDRFKILMCHMPVCWVSSGSLYDFDVDTVFAGHAHGGQVRIPYVGGLYAPDQGWFPGDVAGVYVTNEADWKHFRQRMAKWAKEQKYDASYYNEDKIYEPSYLVLSRGLGNTDFPPRFNNVPEIVVVDFDAP